MDEALKCVVCKDYAKEAVESTCPCVLIYCEKCAIKTNQCPMCESKLTRKQKLNPDEKIYGFVENKLARRLIAQVKIECQNQNCGKQMTLNEVTKHWRRCSFRDFQCSFCQETFNGKEKFKLHVLEQHEDDFLSIFDENLEGSFVKREFDRIIFNLKLDNDNPDNEEEYVEDGEEKEEEVKEGHKNQELWNDPQTIYEGEGEELKESDENQQTGNSREEPAQNSILNGCQQNYIEMKENMKRFIDKMKKDQRKEYKQLLLKQRAHLQHHKKSKSQEECLIF